MINKHYSVEHLGEGFYNQTPFTSLSKAKQFYNKIKLKGNECKILFQDRCELIEDSYYNNEWIHKEKGIRIYG